MKLVKYFFGVLMGLLALVSCNDNNDVHLGDYAYVRLDNTIINLVKGEVYQVHASVNKAGNGALHWSIKDSNIATVESLNDTTAVIEAIGIGSTLLKVESSDGSLSYYADVLVSEGVPSIKILSVGNGTNGVDALSAYLRDVANESGKTIEIGLAYVNGASLADHLANGTESNAVYNYNFTDVTGSTTTQTGMTLRTLMKQQTWDYIVFEESMPLSGMPEGYLESLPGLIAMASSVSTNPNLKIYVHQPWAYAQSATDASFGDYDWNQEIMFNAIADVMSQVRSIDGITGVIPTGTAIQNVRTSYLNENVLIDDVHLSSLGKFVAACTWYETMFGEVTTYAPTDFTSFDCQLSYEAAHDAVITPDVVTDMVDFKEKLNLFVLENPVYIDFGPVASSEPFNNFLQPTDAPLGNLKDEEGNSTGFDLSVIGQFSGTLDRGLDNGLGFPLTASQDMFFCDGINIPEASFRVSNLNKNEKYTFVFYGHINDNGTETLYTVTGKNEGTGTLCPDYNMNNVVVIEGIEPTDNADITITLTYGPNNVQWAKFFCVNTMLIAPDGYQF